MKKRGAPNIGSQKAHLCANKANVPTTAKSNGTEITSDFLGAATHEPDNSGADMRINV